MFLTRKPMLAKAPADGRSAGAFLMSRRVAQCIAKAMIWAACRRWAGKGRGDGGPRGGRPLLAELSLFAPAPRPAPMTPRVDSWEARAVADRLAAQWRHGDALRGAGAGAGPLQLVPVPVCWGFPWGGYCI